MIRTLIHWWNRRHEEDLDRAKRAEAEADQSLTDALARWPKTREDSQWIRSAREANHLTELFNNRRLGGNPDRKSVV